MLNCRFVGDVSHVFWVDVLWRLGVFKIPKKCKVPPTWQRDHVGGLVYSVLLALLAVASCCAANALYSVAWLIPQIAVISFMLCVCAWYSFTAFSTFALLALGLPPLRPLALAACNPSFVRCTVISRSNWLIADRTVVNSLPVGVVVSMDSFRLTSLTPWLFHSSIRFSKSLVDRPKRERDSIITSSPSRKAFFSLSSSGLFAFVPVIFSL